MQQQIACDELCSFRLPETEMKRLNILAKAKGVKRSKLIRQALTHYLASVTVTAA